MIRPDFFPKCRSCGQNIAWVETEAGKKMPIDPATATGSLYLERDGARALVAIYIKAGELPGRAGALRYTSHFATCPNAKTHRKPTAGKSKCPVTGCEGTCGADQVCCKTHWFKVPKDVRDKIWAAYQSKPGSDDHRKLVFDAIAALSGDAA